MVSVPEIAAPSPVVAECQVTVPRDLASLTEELGTVLQIYWERVQGEVLIPLLEAGDIEAEFQKLAEPYRRWQRFSCDALINLVGKKSALALADEAEQVIHRLNEERGEEKLCQASIAFASALKLRTLIRQSYGEMAQQSVSAEIVTAETKKLDPPLTASEMCVSTIIYYLMEGTEEHRANAETLARWSYVYADMATAELGDAQLRLGMYSKLSVN